MNSFHFPDDLGDLRRLVNKEWASLPDDTPLLRSDREYDASKGLDIDLVNAEKNEAGYYNFVPEGHRALYFHNG